MRFLITGSAGFIGFHLAEKLLTRGHVVVGLDNINSYYDTELKKARLKRLFKFSSYRQFENNLHILAEAEAPFKKYGHFDVVVNLAAQAGVRHSLQFPQTYIDSNVTGFLNILELSVKYKVGHLLYASSSSVYGLSSDMPYKETHPLDKPASLYAATKIQNESMAHVYNHIYGLPVTGLRFFTVYGPWGRPDMALMIFMDKISRREPIQVFNGGDMKRDFTYIDDIVNGILALIEHGPHVKAGSQVFNIGRGRAEPLMRFVGYIEAYMDRRAEIEYQPMQPGDVPATYANISKLKKLTGWEPKTDIRDGIKETADWFKKYYLKT